MDDDNDIDAEVNSFGEESDLIIVEKENDTNIEWDLIAEAEKIVNSM
ncbi:446_t:CDS:2 [Funneliformis mosseae]|uniref:446_t:CDS:1 n=1 Tax=Funneliformis mosseae TaxID=27381 RepID=A0A9N9A3E2_FUNMO|nr:446_t:CDS:2 [Funneliformis mosseae]